MEEFCKNCGAKLVKDAQFCQDCGTPIKTPEKSFCENCGAEITASENFCENCGTNINPSKKIIDVENIIKEHKIPILIGIVALLAIITVLMVLGSFNDNSTVTLPPQTVTVGARYFEIPGNFHGQIGAFDIQTQDGVFSNSDSWSDGYDTITIGILSSAYSVDLESVAAAGGGVHKTMMGYSGYYNEIDINDYSFTFVLDDKICVVETTSPYLFDEIKVL